MAKKVPTTEKPSAPSPETSPEVSNTNPTPAPAGEVVETLDSIAATVDTAAPTPNEPAIAHTLEKQKAELDGRGKNQEGKKRGPYNKDEKKTKSIVGKVSKTKPDGTPLDAEKAKRCYMAGVSSVDGLVQIGVQAFGYEWDYLPPEEKEVILPDGTKTKIKISERDQAHDVFGRAFVYKGWEGPSPLVSLFVFTVGFVLKRMNKPETKSKIKGFFQKLKDEIKRRREGKGAQAPAPAPAPDPAPVVQSENRN